MLLIMGVTLYTSRVVLDQLGIEDYGIYNVVGGIIVLFTFISNSLQLSSQRYFSYELGKNETTSNITSIFKASINLHFIVAFIFVLASQTIGYWFLLNKLNIPSGRMGSAVWVYEISILTGVISLFRVPYNALIVAYEKMQIYAYYSIIEVILKVTTIIILIWLPYDKLIEYAILICITTLIVNLLYIHFCHTKLIFNFSKAKSDKLAQKGMLSFSGWMLLLGVSNMSATQGIGFILNISYGVVINAAIGIANQVNSAVTQFISNFQLSFNPPIIKYYANSEYRNLFNLLFQGSKLSFFLLLLISFPIFTNIDFILNLWLKKVPDYSNSIVQCILLYALIDCLINPIATVVQAMGDIKRYQLIASIFILSILPICFICIHLNVSPIYVFMARVIINLASLFWRISFLKKKLSLGISEYYRRVLKPILIIICVASVSFFVVAHIQSSTTHIYVSIAFWVLLVLLTIFVGLNSDERKYLVKIIRHRL